MTVADKNIDKILQGIVEVIVEAIDPDKIILFGSGASGNWGPDSDFDLLIVDSKPFGEGRSRRKVLGDLSRALFDFEYPLDLLIFTREEVDEWQDSRNHIIGRALREGRILYERD